MKPLEPQLLRKQCHCYPWSCAQQSAFQVPCPLRFLLGGQEIETSGEQGKEKDRRKEQVWVGGIVQKKIFPKWERSQKSRSVVRTPALIPKKYHKRSKTQMNA